MECDLVVLDVGMMPNTGPIHTRNWRSRAERRGESESTGNAGQCAAVDSQSGLSAGHGSAAAEVWLHRLPFHLFPV